ncbi:hypothetical protein GMA19_03045 [Paenibacillus polymyxa E681]|nr:hypothetical protein [Paenibacillus polymyxa]ADM70851.2 hypothetical protein PPE_03028 [Paenibacillus polymyxa E681]QNV57874.1 hypothetical protein GE561_03045 [Paenibacillus polymyxa E681]QNV62711.1 hypothetical protein GMA19_03045 [Paenibacillus polymyxa E681]
MKNIKKASVVSVLSLALAIPLTASAAVTTDVAPATTDSTAVSQSANTSTDVTTPTPGNHDITPQHQQDKFGSTVKSLPGEGSATSSFKVTGGYGYVKINFKNNSSDPVKIIVTHNDTNKNYYEEVLSGKSSDSWKSYPGVKQGVRSGDYTVTFRGGKNGDGTKPVDVTFSGFTTDNTSEL